MIDYEYLNELFHFILYSRKVLFLIIRKYDLAPFFLDNEEFKEFNDKIRLIIKSEIKDSINKSNR